MLVSALTSHIKASAPTGPALSVGRVGWPINCRSDIIDTSGRGSQTSDARLQVRT